MLRGGCAGAHVTYEITPEDVIALWEKQDGRCAISGVYLTHHVDGSGKKEYNASIDRISGDKGYTIHNIATCLLSNQHHEAYALRGHVLLVDQDN